jgi:hypothetical protein
MKRGGKGSGPDAKQENGHHKEGQQVQEKAPSVFHTIRLILCLIIWCPLTGIPGMLAICEYISARVDPHLRFAVTREGGLTLTFSVLFHQPRDADPNENIVECTKTFGAVYFEAQTECKVN